MKRLSIFPTLTAFAIFALASSVLATPAFAADGGATQIAGVGSYAGEGDCEDPQGAGSDYALVLIGSLQGCHYTFVQVSRCSPGGAYYESGVETFVGMYNGNSGTFDTTYVFTATYKNCPAFTGEIAGRCQHPITAGSGTGVFEGVRGRLDFKDDIETGTFPYRGHLAWGDGLMNHLSLKSGINVLGQSLTGGGC